MKKIVLSLLAVLGCVSLLPAQEFTVQHFELRPTDLTAKIANKRDLNGVACAMVKIFVAQPSISVPDDMMLGEIEKPAPSEFRVFMPAGSRRIRIYATGFLPLEYNFPEPLETMRTYGLHLSLPERLYTPYKVGDYYEANGKKGVVFEVDASGLHGKIIALTDASERMAWEDARSYCVGLGPGWRLPTKEELLEIYRRKSLLNAALRNSDKMLGVFWYWSETEAPNGRAWYVYMYNGYTSRNLKYDALFVRAVSDF